ncbi:MAG: methyl-accepting chemotaxis protein [Candidatus Omnitrophota bacterium]
MMQELRRRHYLIKKRFQLKYTISIAGILILVMLASGIGLYMGMWASIIENFSEFKVSQDMETAKRISDLEGVRYKRGDYRLEKIFREAELLSEQQRQALKNGLNAVNRSLLPKAALFSVVILIGGILISHRIAGPMYRFERSAEAVKEGNLRVHFNVRRGDEMKKTALYLEEMTEALRTDIEGIKEANNRLKGGVDAIAANIPQKDAQYLRDYIKRIDEALAKYKT